MLFGKIDYLNLLPFHIFLKSMSAQSAFKMASARKTGTPSKLCADLKARRVDAAVISSIQARKYRTLNMGICAKNEVISVLVRKNSPHKLDPASHSSNMLARILGLDGEVIIGDKALQAYLKEVRIIFMIWQSFGIKKLICPLFLGILLMLKIKVLMKRLLNNS